MKINWFSPLPPAHTDIAHYTSRILPALSAVADVTVWTTRPHWTRAVERFASVRRYQLDRLPFLELNRSDVTFYQIGNNPRFHWPIWHVSRMYPGVVVLHDFRLHHLFDWIYREHYQNPRMYLEVMNRFYGNAAFEDAKECYKTNAANIEYMAERYPLTELALENAIGAIVHSHESYEELRTIAEWPLAYAPLPFPAPEQIQVRGLEIPFRLIVFGYLGRNRRLDSILEALACFEQKDKFRLDIFGKLLKDEDLIRQKIRRLNLTQSVELHGFVSEQALHGALSAAHLAINLRFPTVGEASGTQLRIWSHALPSMVSDVGWFSSLPPESVAFVRHDENEIEDIRKHLSAFLDSPESFTRMGERGFEELKNHHSPVAYANQIVDMANHAKRFRPQFAARTLAKRASLPLTEWVGEDGLDESLTHMVSAAVSLVQG